jgi:glycoprotease/Kae1 family metallohydrolase
LLVLGIESSAHTLGVGVVKNGKVLSNEKTMYEIGGGGILPAKAADLHASNIENLIKRAVDSAGCSAEEIDAIGYTKGPGLGPCLRVGQLAALTIAKERSIPLLPVNHAVAHIEITRHLAKAKDPLVLYVSGGNSQILGLVQDPFRHYHIYGETFDIGVGNMLDGFARAAKLVPAWGSSVEKLAGGGRYVSMPYSVKGMDFTFTGLLTNAIKLLGYQNKKDVAYSLQETAFAMLCEATERALLLNWKDDLLLSGGVAQSKRLSEMLGIMAHSHKVRFHVAPNEYNADNGAMIAIVAEKMYRQGFDDRRQDYSVDQRYRIDSVEIGW